MQHFKAFIAGFIATLVFHQGVYSLFYLAGAVPAPPFSMAATEPLGVPQVISLALWGGLWGNVIWVLIRSLRGAGYWLWALVLGAAGPSAVALLIVFPLKDLPVDGKTVIGALILNAAWGFGMALIMRLIHSRPVSRI